MLYSILPFSSRSTPTTLLCKMAAVAMCPAPVLVLPGSLQSADQPVNERFYKFGSPSPAEQASPAMYSDLEDSGFHSDAEIQKVRRNDCYS